MGTGKTIITLTALYHLIKTKRTHKTLIIAPLRVALSTWINEVNKWEEFKSFKLINILGSPQQRIKALEQIDKLDSNHIYIINRELVSWLVDYFKGSLPFDTLIIDELSSFKSSQSLRFKKLKNHSATRIIGLTGTPTPNGYSDLWAQMYLLDKGERLGKNITTFRNSFFIPSTAKGHIVYKYALRLGSDLLIKNLIKDICLYISSENLKDMPKTITQTIPLTLPNLKEYQRFKKNLFLNEHITATSQAVLLNKLLQFSNGAIYDDNKQVNILSNHKIEALAELIEQANGQPILLFYNFKHDLQRIKKAFPYAVVFDDISLLDKWNNKEIPLLLAHPMSSGHGLNMQFGGNIIIWFGVPWSLELYQQANARLIRKGQQQPVVIYHLVTADTVEMDVLNALENKKNVQQELLQFFESQG